jgi:hypothetical protein
MLSSLERKAAWNKDFAKVKNLVFGKKALIATEPLFVVFGYFGQIWHVKTLFWHLLGLFWLLQGWENLPFATP